MDNLIIGFILFLFGTLLRGDFKESIIDSDELVKELLTLHQEYCGSTTDLCMADSERNPGPLMYPMPCCVQVTCSCLSRCEAEHTCCPMYLMRLQGDRDMKVQNQSNQTGQEALNGRGIMFQSGPEIIKLFSCSTQLSMKFFLLINIKMPTIVGILTFMSRKNCILGLSEPEKS